jgi:large subunit ribosomal protein L23
MDYTQKSEINFENVLDCIKLRLKTLKTQNLAKKKQYVFLVDKKLKKEQIKSIIEEIYNVTVISVNTCILPIKFKKVNKYLGKKTCFKKAYVKIKKNQYL